MLPPRRVLSAGRSVPPSTVFGPRLDGRQAPCVTDPSGARGANFRPPDPLISMRTKRSTGSAPAAPISAGVAGRARRTTTDDDPDGDARAQLLRVIALLGIGLVAAAILLPSGDPGVVVPGDVLQPATAAHSSAVGEDEADAAVGATAKLRTRGRTSVRGKSAFATGSSAASVAGDELARATAGATTPDLDPQPRTPKSRATTTSPKRAAAKRRAARRTHGPKRRDRTPASGSAAPAPAPARASAPAPVATPSPAPTPKPRRARGGPKAEFGGL